MRAALAVALLAASAAASSDSTSYSVVDEPRDDSALDAAVRRMSQSAKTSSRATLHRPLTPPVSAHGRQSGRAGRKRARLRITASDRQQLDAAYSWLGLCSRQETPPQKSNSYNDISAKGSRQSKEDSAILYAHSTKVKSSEPLSSLRALRINTKASTSEKQIYHSEFVSDTLSDARNAKPRAHSAATLHDKAVPIKKYPTSDAFDQRSNHARRQRSNTSKRLCSVSYDAIPKADEADEKTTSVYQDELIDDTSVQPTVRPFSRKNPLALSLGMFGLEETKLDGADADKITDLRRLATTALERSAYFVPSDFVANNEDERADRETQNVFDPLVVDTTRDLTTPLNLQNALNDNKPDSIVQHLSQPAHWTTSQAAVNSGVDMRELYRRQRPRRRALRRLFEAWIENGRNGRFVERIQTTALAAVHRRPHETPLCESLDEEHAFTAIDMEGFLLALALAQSPHYTLSQVMLAASFALHLATIDASMTLSGLREAYRSMSPVLTDERCAFLAQFAYDRRLRASWQHVFLASFYVRWAPIGWNPDAFALPSENDTSVYLSLLKLQPAVYGEWVVRSESVSFDDAWMQAYTARLAAVVGYVTQNDIDTAIFGHSSTGATGHHVHGGAFHALSERAKPTFSVKKVSPTARNSREWRVVPSAPSAPEESQLRLSMPAIFEVRLRQVHPGVLRIATSLSAPKDTIVRLTLLRDVVALDLRHPRVSQAALDLLANHEFGRSSFDAVAAAAERVALEGVAARLCALAQMQARQRDAVPLSLPWRSISHTSTVVAAIGPAWAGRMRHQPVDALIQLVAQASVFANAQQHSMDGGQQLINQFTSIGVLLAFLGSGEAISEADIAAAIFRFSYVRRRDVSDYAAAQVPAGNGAALRWRQPAATAARWERPSNDAPDAPLQRVVSEELFYHILHTRNVWRAVAGRSSGSRLGLLPAAALLQEACARLGHGPHWAELHVAAPLYGPGQEATFAQALMAVLAAAGADAVLVQGASLHAAATAVGVDSRTCRNLEMVAHVLALDLRSPSVLVAVLLVALEMQAMDASGDPFVRVLVRRLFPEVSAQSLEVERFLIARRNGSSDDASDAGTVNLDRESSERETSSRASLFAALEVLCALRDAPPQPRGFTARAVRQLHAALCRCGAARLARELRALDYPAGVCDALASWADAGADGTARSADELGALVSRAMLETLDYAGDISGGTHVVATDGRGDHTNASVRRPCCIIC